MMVENTIFADQAGKLQTIHCRPFLQSHLLYVKEGLKVSNASDY